VTGTTPGRYRTEATHFSRRPDIALN
jgi:hypothetical protein